MLVGDAMFLAALCVAVIGSVAYAYVRQRAELRACAQRQRQRYYATPEAERVVNVIFAAAVCRQRRLEHSYVPHIYAAKMVRHLMSRLHGDARAILLAGPRILSILEHDEAAAATVLQQEGEPHEIAAHWIDPPVEKGTLRRPRADPVPDA